MFKRIVFSALLALPVEGTVDLIAAITLATVYGAAAHMGPAYWIPAFWVPALLVTHYITFIVLLKYWRKERPKRRIEADRKAL